MRIYLDGNLAHEEELEKGCGNQVFDYSTTIDLRSSEKGFYMSNGSDMEEETKETNSAEREQYVTSLEQVNSSFFLNSTSSKMRNTLNASSGSDTEEQTKEVGSSKINSDIQLPKPSNCSFILNSSSDSEKNMLNYSTGSPKHKISALDEAMMSTAPISLEESLLRINISEATKEIEEDHFVEILDPEELCEKLTGKTNSEMSSVSKLPLWLKSPAKETSQQSKWKKPLWLSDEVPVDLRISHSSKTNEISSSWPDLFDLVHSHKDADGTTHKMLNCKRKELAGSQGRDKLHTDVSALDFLDNLEEKDSYIPSSPEEEGLRNDHTISGRRSSLKRPRNTEMLNINDTEDLPLTGTVNLSNIFARTEGGLNART